MSKKFIKKIFGLSKNESKKKGKMAQSRFYTLCFLIFAVLLSSCSSKSKIESSNKVVPKYTKFVTMEGDRHVFEELQGKKTVVIFWTQWCRYSRPVIKEIDKIAGNRKDANFLAISLDKEDDYKKLKEEIDIRNLDHIQHAFSGAEFYDEAFLVLGGDTLPTVYVLDKDGRVLGVGDDAEVVKQLL